MNCQSFSNNPRSKSLPLEPRVKLLHLRSTWTTWLKLWPVVKIPNQFYRLPAEMVSEMTSLGWTWNRKSMDSLKRVHHICGLLHIRNTCTLLPKNIQFFEFITIELMHGWCWRSSIYACGQILQMQFKCCSMPPVLPERSPDPARTSTFDECAASIMFHVAIMAALILELHSISALCQRKRLC